MDDKVEVIEAPAENTLPKLLERGYPRFDFIYINANQKHYPDYLEAAINMAKSGSVIVTERKIDMTGSSWQYWIMLHFPTLVLSRSGGKGPVSPSQPLRRPQ